MRADDPKSKWSLLDGEALKAFYAASSSTTVFYPVPSSLLPSGVQAMPGVASYFISAYPQPVLLANGMHAGAEMAVVRTEGATAKAYNYVVATAPSGAVYFNGPHKDFQLHHYPSTAPIGPQELFGHVKILGQSK